MMICPKCAETKTRAIHTAQSGGTTQRIRHCVSCEFSFNTVERPNIAVFTEEEKEDYEAYLNAET